MDTQTVSRDLIRADKASKTPRDERGMLQMLLDTCGPARSWCTLASKHHAGLLNGLQNIVHCDLDGMIEVNGRRYRAADLLRLSGPTAARVVAAGTE